MRKLGHAPGIIAAALAGIGFAWAATAMAQGLSAPSPAQAAEPLVTAVPAAERAVRLVSLTHFLGIAAHPTTLILDHRPAEAFAQGHLEGAVNVPMSAMTAEALAAVIGDPARPVLVYGEANLSADGAPLALSNHLFVTLHNYGYRNVFELSQPLDLDHRRVRWVRGAAAS